MDHQNPYAAPQTLPQLEAVPRPAVEFGPELQPVANGAYYCHDAFKTMLSLFAGIFLYPFPSWFEFAAKYFLPCFIVIAHLLHLYGLSKLRQVPRDSGAGGLLTTAFVTFGLLCMSGASAWLLIITGVRLDLAAWLVLSYVLLLVVSFTALLWGLDRVGNDVQLPQIRRWAKLSLTCGGCWILLQLLNWIPETYAWLQQTVSPDFLKVISLLYLASWLLTAILGVVFYALALRNLIRLEELLSPDMAEVSPHSELRTSSQPLNAST